MLIQTLPIMALPIPIQINLHLRDLFEAAFPEQRVSGRGGFEVALQALLVGEVGAPFHQLGASATALVGRVRVDYVED